MTARHGCGPRAMIGTDGAGGGLRALAWAGALALSLVAGGGTAGACHIKPRDGGQPDNDTPKVTAAEVLNPTSLVNAPPPPTPTAPPAIPATPAALSPSPLANPPAADQILAPPPAVATHSPGAEPTCSCSCPPINPPPIAPDNPPAPLNPGPPPPASPNAPNAPEPSTIVSALAMISLAVVARRRRRLAI